MKKILLIFTLALLTQTSFSQSTNSWLDAGSDWHYATWYFAANYPTGFNHYYYTIDTLIGNRIFQQVKVEQQLRTTDNNGNNVIGDTTFLPSQYFFTSNDTVYILNSNNTLQFVWFNNPNIGDIWNFGLQYDQTLNIYTYAYSQVDSIKFVTINGQSLKEIYSHSCKDTIGTPIQLGDSALFVMHISRINTKFGPIVGFNGINKYESAFVTDGLIADNLLCFESNSFPFYQVGTNDCNNGILTYNEELNVSYDTYPFPNPATDKIYFKNIVQDITIKIYNNIGQLQQTSSYLSNNGIDIKNLTKGFYTYSITDNQNNIKKIGKFIKE
jgi:hypothetical protein